MKTVVLAPLALILGTLAVAGCDNQPTPAAKAGPNAPADITIGDGRLVLPAVKGNPGAVYFTVHNDSASARTIRGAEVEGAASAMMHKMTMTGGVASMDMVAQVRVPAMGMVAFAPGGLHVMADELDAKLAKGGTTNITLAFVNGDKAVFPAEILAAGDAR